MELFVISFLAGILTVAAPCILPLLPVIIGGSIARQDDTARASRWRRPLIVTISLAVSVIIFTLLLKATTALLGIPHMFWQILSAVIIIIIGLNFLWPALWEKFALKTKLAGTANKRLGSGLGKNGIYGDVLTGLALGPVFNSCSPTYLFIVAVILPQAFLKGFAYLLAYAMGLAFVLLTLAYVGQAAVAKLGWLSNPAGWFKRVIGILFLAVGLAVVTGSDKKFQAYVLERGWYDPISRLEHSLQ